MAGDGVECFGTECRITCGFINGGVLIDWMLAGLLVPARAADLTIEGEAIDKFTSVGCYRIQGGPMPHLAGQTTKSNDSLAVAS